MLSEAVSAATENAVARLDSGVIPAWAVMTDVLGMGRAEAATGED